MSNERAVEGVTNHHYLEVFAHSFGKHGQDKGIGDSCTVPHKKYTATVYNRLLSTYKVCVDCHSPIKATH